ncbi:MAG: hypothetical protein HZA01_11880 [Nitrospinae bacterium]|nr:hypothetical protein [Nitrospinota bacterium]
MDIAIFKIILITGAGVAGPICFGYIVLSLVRIACKAAENAKITAPTAFGAGSGLLTMGLFCLSRLDIQVVKGKPLLISVWAFLLVFFLFWAFSRKQPFSINTSRLFSLQAAINISGWLIFSGILCFVALGNSSVVIHNWDVMIQAAFKAKIFYHETIQRTDFFQRPDLAYADPHYPLYGAFLFYWIYSLAGEINEQLVMVYPSCFFVLSSLALRNSILEPAFSKNNSLSFLASWLVVFLYVGTPILLGGDPNNSVFYLQTLDFTLAFFYFLSVVEIYKWLATKNIYYLYSSAILISFLGWIKQEGIMLAAVLYFLILLFYSYSRKGGKELVKTASPILLSLAIFSPWLYFYINTTKTTIDYVGIAASENNFLSTITNLPEAFSTTVCSLGNPDSWHYLWPAFLVVLIFSLFKRQGENYFLLLAAFLPFIGFSFAFQLYPLGFNYVIDMIADRVLFNMALPAFFVVGLALEAYFADLKDKMEKGLKAHMLLFSILIFLFLSAWGKASSHGVLRAYDKFMVMYKTCWKLTLEGKRRYMYGDYYTFWTQKQESFVSPIYTFTNLVPHWVSMLGNYALYPKKIFVSPPGEIFIGGFGKIKSNENITWQWLRNNGIKSVVLFEAPKSGSLNYGAVPMENYYNGKVLPFLRERNKNIYVFTMLDQGAQFLRQGIYGEALKSYKKVLSISPDDALAQKGLSNVCDELRKRGLVKEECDQP